MSSAPNYRFKRSIQILQKEIPQGARVLETGSNDGSFRGEIAGWSTWTTIDKYGDPNIQCDLNSHQLELPFEEASFDVVVCTEVLEHLTHGSKLCEEFARVICPRGACYISVPNVVSLPSRVRWGLGIVPTMAASGDCGHPLGGTGVELDGRWVAAHVVDFNKKRLYGYLARAGLKVTKSYRMPATFGPLRTIARLTPTSFGDFLFVKAVRTL